MTRPRRSLWQRLRYRFDSTISRGTLPVIGYLGLFTLGLVFVAALVLAITGTAINEDHHPGIGEAFWQSLLRILDPGTFSGDNGWFLRVVMLVVTLIGISIAAVLIGLIASGIEQRIDQLRRGRSMVVESGHTLILGWSSRIHSVVSELCVANENQRRPAIVILASRDKEAMEDELSTRIADTRSTRVICRSGDPASLNDLRMASAEVARSIIVMGSGDGVADADAAVVKTALAVLHVVEDPSVPVVAEVEDAEIGRAIGEAGNGRLLTVRSADVVARVTAQACRQPGLSAVCQDLLDFDGDEIYFARVDELAGRRFGDAVLAFEESSVIGLRHTDGAISLNPPMSTVIAGDDQVIAIAEDDDTIVFSGFRDEPAPRGASEGSHAPAPHQMLVVGWNPLGPAILRELDQFAARGSTVDVIVDPDVIDPHELDDLGLERLEVRYEAERGNLDVLTETVSGRVFDYAIILGYHDGMSAAEADARTLLTLLLLRRALGAGTDGRRSRVVTELLDASDVELARVTGADDFVVSDALSSYMVAQLSENPALHQVFGDLFDAAGPALGVKAAERYVGLDEPMPFARVVAAAREHGEVAIGYRLTGDGGAEPSVVMNPAKSSTVTLGVDDQVIVIGSPE
jgi:voltage-gated potassium channel Kch